MAPANLTRASFDAPFDLLQVIIDKFSPLLFEAVSELHPLSLELIRIHHGSLLCEIVRARFYIELILSSQKFLRYFHASHSYDLLASSGLVRIAQMARIGPAAVWWRLHASTVGIGFWTELFQQAGKIFTLL